jgi:hypothetical protein
MSQPGWCLRLILISLTFLAISLVACREKAKVPATQPSATTQEVVIVPTAAPSTEQDDPLAPACLPQTGMVGRWRKHDAIRVVKADSAQLLVPPADAARWRFFAITRVSRCAYAFDHSNGGTVLARIFVVDTASTDDAYGLLTCQSAPSELFKIGGETRVERGTGLTLHCWQGRCYVQLATDHADSESTEESIRLLMQIVGRIGREDPPALLSAMPQDPRVPAKYWLVRNLASLPSWAANMVSGPDRSVLSELLGLGPNALMCIGSYEVPGAVGPDVVWIVRYSTAKGARDAHARYSRYIAQHPKGTAASTNLLPPHGQYVVGTWTAEEESIQYIMPRIQKLLPR